MSKGWAGCQLKRGSLTYDPDGGKGGLDSKKMSGFPSSGKPDLILLFLFPYALTSIDSRKKKRSWSGNLVRQIIA